MKAASLYTLCRYMVRDLSDRKVASAPYRQPARQCWVGQEVNWDPPGPFEW